MGEAVSMQFVISIPRGNHYPTYCISNHLPLNSADLLRDKKVETVWLPGLPQCSKSREALESAVFGINSWKYQVLIRKKTEGKPKYIDFKY